LSTYFVTSINFKSKFYQYIFSTHNIDKSQAEDFLLEGIRRMAKRLRSSEHPDEVLLEIELHKNELLKEYEYSFKGTKQELVHIAVCDKWLFRDFQYIVDLYNKYIGTLYENKRIEIIKLAVGYIDWTHKLAKARIIKKRGGRKQKQQPSVVTIESKQEPVQTTTVDNIQQSHTVMHTESLANNLSLVFDNDYVKTVNLFSEFMFSNPDILAKFIEFMNTKNKEGK